MNANTPRRVVITGGSGFIGTNVVERYARSGVVLNLDQSRPRNEAHLGYWKKIDICDGGALRDAIASFSPDLVVHMAARVDLEGRTVADYDANTRGVENLIEAARAVPDLRRVIFTSSMMVCKLGYIPQHATDFSPGTVYGESKAKGELIVREKAAGLPWTIVRPTSIWGPWFDVPYRRFFEAVLRGVYVHPKGRRVLRSYGFVLNVVQQIAALADARREKVEGKVFYLADYDPTDVYHWSQLVAEEFGVRKPREVPLPLLAAAARVGDVLQWLGYADPPLTSFRLHNLMTESVHDLAELQQVAGPLPYSLTEGTKHTVAWMNARAAR